MTAELIPISCEPVGESIGELIADIQAAHSKGEVSSLAIAIVYRDGSTTQAFSTLPNTATMLGALERLKCKILRKFGDIL
jgi:hypothetical protein